MELFDFLVDNERTRRDERASKGNFSSRAHFFALGVHEFGNFAPKVSLFGYNINFLVI